MAIFEAFGDCITMMVESNPGLSETGRFFSSFRHPRHFPGDSSLKTPQNTRALAHRNQLCRMFLSCASEKACLGVWCTLFPAQDVPVL